MPRLTNRVARYRARWDTTYSPITPQRASMACTLRRARVWVRRHPHAQGMVAGVALYCLRVAGYNLCAGHTAHWYNCYNAASGPNRYTHTLGW